MSRPPRPKRPTGWRSRSTRPTYAPGEVAKLKVSPRFAGELLVTVGSETLLTTVTASVPEGGATIDIPVGDDWGAGAYVTATLFRPGDARESRMPARAIGVKWLAVDPGARKLAVSLGTVAQDGAAPDAVDTGFGDRAAARDRRLCDGRGGRPRHPQPHQLPGARSGSLVLRPAPARPRAARPLRPPDRRLARRDRQAPDRRRRRADDRRTAARRPRSWSPSSPDRCGSTPTARRRSTSTSRSSTAPCAS